MYHYEGNNPVTYSDPNGRQSVYLPGGGTSFNGPNPGLKYNMNEYSKDSQTIADAIEMGTSKTAANGLVKLWDYFFNDKKFANAAARYKVTVNREFESIKSEAKASGKFDFDKDGHYSSVEAKVFSDYVNNTMSLNYSNQDELGPYRGIQLPKLLNKEAKSYLNNTIEIKPFLKLDIKLEKIQKEQA